MRKLPQRPTKPPPTALGLSWCTVCIRSAVVQHLQEHNDSAIKHKLQHLRNLLENPFS